MNWDRGRHGSSSRKGDGDDDRSKDARSPCSNVGRERKQMLTPGMICEINSPTVLSAFKVGAPWEKLKRQGFVKLLTKGTDRSLVPYWEVQSEEGGTVFAVYDVWLKNKDER